MFHKVKNVSAMPDYKLSVQFCEGVTKIYDVKPLFDQLPVFTALQNEEEFFGVAVDVDMALFGTMILTFPAMSFGKTEFR